MNEADTKPILSEEDSEPGYTPARVMILHLLIFVLTTIVVSLFNTLGGYYPTPSMFIRSVTTSSVYISSVLLFLFITGESIYRYVTGSKKYDPDGLARDYLWIVGAVLVVALISRGFRYYFGLY